MKRSKKQYRQSAKTSDFKNKKSNTQRQADFVKKEEAEDKKRTSLYISKNNLFKIMMLQKTTLMKKSKKISKSEAINLLLDKVRS
jgi:ribosomal protein L35AE/L33A